MRGGQSSVAREEEGQPRRRRPQTGEPEPGGQEFNIDDIIMRRRDLESDEQEGREREGRKNPLNWFGILVPQNLRQSQQNFIKGRKEKASRILGTPSNFFSFPIQL